MAPQLAVSNTVTLCKLGGVGRRRFQIQLLMISLVGVVL